jgi:hemolysin III
MLQHRFTANVPNGENDEEMMMDDIMSTYSSKNSSTKSMYELNPHGFCESRKDDNRLFPEFLLYCEGMHRPSLRGISHLVCTILFPLGFWHLYIEANNHLAGEMASLVYVLGNFFCCFISSLYHIGTWSPKTEIFLQKLDHCGIAICSAFINIPVAVLLLPQVFGIPLAVLSMFTCGWTCWNIVALNRPGVWRLAVVASVIALFFPVLLFHFTAFEWATCIGNAVFQGLGVYIFTKRKPDPCPAIFGYHEVFHVCTVLGFLCVYLCNWSVIRRTCNPYAHHLDVREVIAEWWYSAPAYAS